MASGTVPGAAPFDTLQHALNQANPGDTINVNPSYQGNEYITLPAGVTGVPARLVVWVTTQASRSAGSF